MKQNTFPYTMEVQILQIGVGEYTEEIAKGEGLLLTACTGEWEELSGPNPNLAFGHLGQTEEGIQQYGGGKA